MVPIMSLFLFHLHVNYDHFAVEIIILAYRWVKYDALFMHIRKNKKSLIQQQL